jgi:hypothetical protein
VLFAIVETYVANHTIMVDDSYEVVSYYDNLCRTQEADYTTYVVDDKPSYLKDALSFIEDIETSDYCNEVFVQNPNIYNVSVEEC